MKFHSSILAPRYAKSHSVFGIAENLAGSYSEIMRDRSEIRRKAFIALIDGRDRSRWPTQNALAEYLDLSPAHVTQMKSGNRPIGNDSADKIERGFGLRVGASLYIPTTKYRPERARLAIPNKEYAPCHSRLT